MPDQSASPTKARLEPNSPPSSTKPTSTSTPDPLARYVHESQTVYESLVAYIRGDDPLDDPSNDKVRSLRQVGAKEEYVRYWRIRYEASFAFLSTRPRQPEVSNPATQLYSRFASDESQAAQFADQDARAVFGCDPIHDAQKKVFADQLARETAKQSFLSGIAQATQRSTDDAFDAVAYGIADKIRALEAERHRKSEQEYRSPFGGIRVNFK